MLNIFVLMLELGQNFIKVRISCARFSSDLIGLFENIVNQGERLFVSKKFCLNCMQGLKGTYVPWVPDFLTILRQRVWYPGYRSVCLEEKQRETVRTLSSEKIILVLS